MTLASASREARVFINCPFDSRYAGLFHALVFAVHDLGFQARHALINDSEPIRLLRIATEIDGCQYSIHDLSRVEMSGSLRMPRFNMPFEAGIAYAAHRKGRHGQRQHHLLLLDSEPHRYQASISDAAGLDPHIHGNDVALIIAAARSFLADKSGLAGLPGGQHIARRYALFQRSLPGLARAGRLAMRELRSLAYINEFQYILVRWTEGHPP